MHDRRREKLHDLHLKIVDFTKEIVHIIPQNSKISWCFRRQPRHNKGGIRPTHDGSGPSAPHIPTNRSGPTAPPQLLGVFLGVFPKNHPKHKLPKKTPKNHPKHKLPIWEFFTPKKKIWTPYDHFQLT